jgi:hypothetical protein
MPRKTPAKSVLPELFKLHRQVSFALVCLGPLSCLWFGASKRPWVFYVIGTTIGLFWLLDLAIRIYIRRTYKLDDPWWLFSGISGRVTFTMGPSFGRRKYPGFLAWPYWVLGVLLINLVIVDMIWESIKNSRQQAVTVQPQPSSSSSEPGINASSSSALDNDFELSCDTKTAFWRAFLISHHPKKLSKVMIEVKVFEGVISAKSFTPIAQLSPDVPFELRGLAQTGAAAGIPVNRITRIEIDGSGEDEQKQKVPIRCTWSQR